MILAIYVQARERSCQYTDVGTPLLLPVLDSEIILKNKDIAGRSVLVKLKESWFSVMFGSCKLAINGGVLAVVRGKNVRGDRGVFLGRQKTWVCRYLLVTSVVTGG